MRAKFVDRGVHQGSGTMRRYPLVARHRWAPVLWLGVVIVLASAPALRAQTAADEMRAMREEMARLRSELNALKEEVRLLKDARAAPPATAPSTAAIPSQESYAQTATTAAPAKGDEEQPSTAEVLPLLQAQVAEHAQTKVESNSKLPVRIFGTIVANTFFNTGEANWLDSPNVVPPPPASPLPSGSFSMTLRQSRFGAIIDGPTIGSWKSSGLIAVDFFGGVPNFQTGQVMGLPRLLYAFARLEGARTAIEVGQDHMILAPRNPTSLAAMSFPDLYRSGNLYLRVPQARVERSFATGTAGEVHAVVGILAPVAGDFAAPSFTFVPPNLGGERSRMPAFQGRLAWRARPQSSYRGLEFGASGHYGREKYATGGIPSWAAALDFDAQVGRGGLGGEWYVGKNLDAFGGSLGQLAKSAGGFVEGRLRATSRLEFNTGVGRDRLFDLNFYPAALAGNTGVYANTIFRWTPEFASSFEYRWLSTMPRQGEARRNNHLNFVLAYSF